MVKRKQVTSSKAKPSDATESSTRLALLFGSKTVMSRPTYLGTSDWSEHIPVAFWLTEVLSPKTFVGLGIKSGSGYFAFCQAVDRLDLNTSCLGFGLWEPHTSTETELNHLKAYNDKHYTTFSNLLNEDPENAVQHFRDGGIDILSMTAASSYRSLGDMFEKWLPKISDRGIIVLHGTGIRAGMYGARRFIDELSESYPFFEFSYGAGLVVIGVGKAIPETLMQLFNSVNNPQSCATIHTVFSRLGQACVDASTAREFEVLYKDARKEIAELKRATASAIIPFSKTTRIGAALSNKEAQPTYLHDQYSTDSVSKHKAAPAPLIPMSEVVPASEVDNLHAQLDTRFYEIAALVKRLTETEDKLRDQNKLQDETQNWQSKFQDASSENDNLKEQLTKSLTSYQSSKVAIADSENAYNAIINSTSWRLTLPFRRTIDILRRVRR